VSAERALLAAIRAAAGADAGVRAVLGNPARLYDNRPKEPIFPFLTIGRVETNPADSSESPALNHAITLHVWSREGGKAEAMEAISALRASLHNAALSVSGHRLVLLNVVYADIFLSPDARATQGLMRLRAITETA
jgi:hypothetical protein